VLPWNALRIRTRTCQRSRREAPQSRHEQVPCVCGEILTTSGSIPNPIEWLWISDVDFDLFAGSVDAEEVYASFGHAFRCPASGHLWVFEAGMDAAPVCYARVESRG
jgi:hypothetical protein